MGCLGERKSVLARVEAAAELGVWVPVTSPPPPPTRVWGCVVPPSSLEGSGVVGLLLWVLKLGRRREVKEGDGGSGVGGRP